MRRVCCCGGETPCIGSDCCISEGTGCGIEARAYTVDLGTVTCKCWTFGFVVTEWDGICPCDLDGPGPLEPFDAQAFLWEFFVDKCAAGEFEQHYVWTCEPSLGTCVFIGADDVFSWPQGTITSTFVMDLATYPLDCDIGYAEPSPLLPFTYTGFTGGANAIANQCYEHPYLRTPNAAPVTAGASFKPCKAHPCNTWQPDEWSGSEPMCSDCSGAWDVVTVAYVVTNEHLLPSHGVAGACSEEGTGGCYTWDEWTALVRYVRKPVCVESGNRSIAGQYAFACATLYIPGTQVWYAPGSPGGVSFWSYMGRRYEEGNQCIWDFPYDAPCYGRLVKLCERIGYGWEFPAFVTIT